MIWREMVDKAMARADGRCECVVLCRRHSRRCDETHGSPSRYNRSLSGPVALRPTTINKAKADSLKNLAMLCPACEGAFKRHQKREVYTEKAAASSGVFRMGIILRQGGA